MSGNICASCKKEIDDTPAKRDGMAFHIHCYADVFSLEKKVNFLAHLHYLDINDADNDCAWMFKSMLDFAKNNVDGDGVCIWVERVLETIDYDFTVWALTGDLVRT